MLTSGQLLADRYRLSRRIAVGGMGEVWEAADTRLDRKVAVKVLKAELSGDPEFLHRFRTEARMTASLNHPGIAAVHDYGETASVPDGPEDTAYLVMELVEGEPLAGIIARGRLSADVTLDLLEQTGNALNAAHERGLVHRDVKPGNILITPSGKVKITDFGIAKAADAAPVTRQGMVMGTAHYIAPEQALGNEAEPASDVYSLAVCGYECLAGHRPFLSENAVTVAMMHIRDMAPPLPPDVPPGARALIEATLVKDPRQRYRNGGEFAAAVSAVRVGQPLPTPSGLLVAQQVQQSMPLPIPQMPAAHPGTRPGIQPVQPPQPTGPVGAAHTGTFRPPPHMPAQPGRNRVGQWVMVAVLAALLLLLGVVLAWKLTAGKTSEQPSSAPASTSQSAQADSADRIPAKAVRINEDDFIGLMGDEVKAKLADYELEPRVQTPQGATPGDLKRCQVTAIAPTGDLAVGTQVKVTCVPR
ncbi:serine/threonine protein kinase [Lentzea sp. NBRC 105346]|uniref:serine/threonine-protein kinase n=1 Tax=Lentzea sp. NBRC 105346 TaxID=3032205 RepID=UPI0024A3A8EE|nr:serine/threonine-protein kinase [Lentzea sp. NBRC 105346]GLZ32662.1 serine/threonine protein kinase [Lentzea sp. NBRC 105346]